MTLEEEKAGRQRRERCTVNEEVKQREREREREGMEVDVGKMRECVPEKQDV